MHKNLILIKVINTNKYYAIKVILNLVNNTLSIKSLFLYVSKKMSLMLTKAAFI